MIGDRMDTDVLAGLEAGLRTFLVLTGLTTPAEVDRFPYRPTRVVDSIADVGLPPSSTSWRARGANQGQRVSG